MLFQVHNKSNVNNISETKQKHFSKRKQIQCKIGNQVIAISRKLKQVKKSHLSYIIINNELTVFDIVGFGPTHKWCMV